ncbi:hypothetical protein ABZX92_44405 [Lentzea sp. NPDC006480]|uniref:hypothetical protein n=1 Tax=Lentzea sp. NPDC006480 TaxID=3157176 RepID=UPI0033AC4AF7
MVIVTAGAGQELFEVVAGESLVDGLGCVVVSVLKGQKSFGHVVEVADVVGCQCFALHGGEIDLYPVELEACMG